MSRQVLYFLRCAKLPIKAAGLEIFAKISCQFLQPSGSIVLVYVLQLLTSE